MVLPNMIMKRYWIENLSFNLNKEVFVANANKPISISPAFKREIIKVDDDNAIVKISIEIKQTSEVPFSIEATICGEFQCKKWDETEDGQHFIYITSVQILFPYLRQAVSTITGMANIPQYVLPVVNIKSLFKDGNHK